MENVFLFTLLVIIALSLWVIKRLLWPAPRRMIRENVFSSLLTYVLLQAYKAPRKRFNEDDPAWKDASRDLLELRVEGLRKYDPIEDVWNV